VIARSRHCSEIVTEVASSRVAIGRARRASLAVAIDRGAGSEFASRARRAEYGAELWRSCAIASSPIAPTFAASHDR
jgi:hypothetical protein